MVIYTRVPNGSCPGFYYEVLSPHVDHISTFIGQKGQFLNICEDLLFLRSEGRVLEFLQPNVKHHLY